MNRSGNIQTDSEGGKRAPMFSDIMVCYGSYEGYVTYRNSSIGSYYVVAMCNLWAKHAHDTSLEELLKLLTKDLIENRDINRNGVQVCEYQGRGFDKHLFFNPGLYIKEKTEAEIP